MRLLLCGGGSGEQTILANKKLNEIIDHNKPILYVPLAMDEEEMPYDGCLEWVKKELFNVDIPSIEMVRSFEELASKNYYDYGAIFIGGGNTFKLLKGLKDSGSFNKIKDYINNNGTIIGGSAGAIIFGKDIEPIHVMDPNDVNLTDSTGFDVLNGISIFCHYTNEYTPEAHEEFKEFLINYTTNRELVIALPEEDTIYVNDDNVEIIGTRPYYIFENGIENRKEIDNDNLFTYNK